MLLIFVDDTICLCKNPADQKLLEAELKQSFEITIEGSIADFLGVKINKRSDGCIELTQPHLIDSILKDLGLINGRKKKACYKRTLAKVSCILRSDKDLPPHNKDWNYHSVVGKLNFLEKSTRPDIAYATHQCACFSSDPRVSHSEAVQRIGAYLLATRMRK